MRKRVNRSSKEWEELLGVISVNLVSQKFPIDVRRKCKRLAKLSITHKSVTVKEKAF